MVGRGCAMLKGLSVSATARTQHWSSSSEPVLCPCHQGCSDLCSASLWILLFLPNSKKVYFEIGNLKGFPLLPCCQQGSLAHHLAHSACCYLHYKIVEVVMKYKIISGWVLITFTPLWIRSAFLVVISVASLAKGWMICSSPEFQWENFGGLCWSRRKKDWKNGREFSEQSISLPHKGSYLESHPLGVISCIPYSMFWLRSVTTDARCTESQKGRCWFLFSPWILSETFFISSESW